MSELSILSTRSLQIQEWMHQTKGTLDSLIIEEESSRSFLELVELQAGSYLEELNDLKIRVLALQSKANQKDPVSGEARYGPKTLLKIESLVTDIHTRYDEMQQIYGAITTKKQALPALVAPQPTNPPIEIENVHDSSTKSDAEANQHTQDDHALQIQAEKIRQQKQNLRKQWFANICKAIEDVNKLELSSDGVTQSLLKLKSEAESRHENIASVFIILLNLLRSIVQRPEDEKLRTVKSTHPTIQGALSKFRSSICVWKALGFSIHLENPSYPDIVDFVLNTNNNYGFTFHTQPNDLSNDGEISSESFHILQECNQIGIGFVFELQEPSLQSQDGLDKWTKWFDGIQHRLQILESFVSS